MSGGIDPGCIHLRLRVAGARVGAVEVASERPLVAEALRGREADAAVTLVPLLFALCGKAQGRAAQLALAAARGEAQTPRLDPAIRREALREHAWRWLLDLPPLLGEDALKPEFLAALRSIANDERNEFSALLDGPQIAALCRRLEAQDVAAAPAPRLLPVRDAQASLECWPRLDAGFCRAPAWQGAAAETGALARRPSQSFAAGLAARWLARLGELRDWAGGLEKLGACGTASSARLAPGRGRALVETARGLLMHEIALDGGRIADYFIVAPTEWNFHPQGPLAGWLLGRDADDRAATTALAGRVVAALDPCVRWELEWL